MSPTGNHDSLPQVSFLKLIFLACFNLQEFSLFVWFIAFSLALGFAAQLSAVWKTLMLPETFQINLLYLGIPSLAVVCNCVIIRR